MIIRFILSAYTVTYILRCSSRAGLKPEPPCNFSRSAPDSSMGVDVNNTKGDDC